MAPEKTRLTFFDVVQKDDFREAVIKRLQSNAQGKGFTFPAVFPKLYKYRPLSEYAVADLKGQSMTATSPLGPDCRAGNRQNTAQCYD